MNLFKYDKEELDKKLDEIFNNIDVLELKKRVNR